ncbi:MAG: hypothetical protein AAF657_27335 [Acidobacteriota bacterium]
MKVTADLQIRRGSTVVFLKDDGQAVYPADWRDGPMFGYTALEAVDAGKDGKIVFVNIPKGDRKAIAALARNSWRVSVHSEPGCEKGDQPAAEATATS